MAPAAITAEHTLPDLIPESAQTQAKGPSIPDLFSLSNQTIAITGAGRGLGITLASASLEAGAHVVCLDILPSPSPTEWQELQIIAKKNGVTVSYDICNITSESDVIAKFEKIASSAPADAPFSGLIACAGIQQRTPALDYPIDDFNRMFNVNVTGTFITAKHAARHFIANKIRGSIVLIASMSGQIANRGLLCTAYNSSKAAVHQMCRSMAQEIGPEHGIRINTISPGYIRTAMTDALLEQEPELERKWMDGALLERLGAPEDFKAPAVFLLAKGSAWMTGADLRVDGGNCAAA
ncbi:D-arabinitol 2-dehydrogenase [ribulose-forming] [Lecanosticta acicola]|uniref:D-arabinitol 2-dehydrogenase [ribulose-forming] n=1 Tax=Lecanosticta acicola TaxID=111012 RepID=A0AAI8Z6D7_9PEZI|nr:D-arabinitol 2-dehydrogenase [ribulose-forming] [Lecanosticta acicola]